MFALLRILLTPLTYRETATDGGINSFQGILILNITIQWLSKTRKFEFCLWPLVGFKRVQQICPFSFFSAPNFLL